jgi:hypothetical protein
MLLVGSDTHVLIDCLIDVIVSELEASPRIVILQSPLVL